MTNAKVITWLSLSLNEMAADGYNTAAGIESEDGVSQSPEALQA